MVTTMNTESLLGLLHISSPALPVGAFAYSQGLETALDQGWCHDAASIGEWITDLLMHGMAKLDGPFFLRLMDGWQANEVSTVVHWNDLLLAFRESKELFDEDCQVGRAFCAWHRSLYPDDERLEWLAKPTVAAMYALAAHRHGINREAGLAGFFWAWCENQVAAAAKALPLGQTDAQHLLLQLSHNLPEAMATAASLQDDAIGSCVVRGAMASAWHERQYSRLFRS